MEFREAFLEQIKNHPAMEAQDAVKLCYQAAFGAEHLLRDKEAAYRYLEQEYEALEADAGFLSLYEQIHPSVCRVNLAAWKREGLPLGWLFCMFVETAANPPENGQQAFQDCLDTVGQLTREQADAGLAGKTVVPFTEGQWRDFLSGYPLHHPQAVHHSENYRNRECPAYRLVCSRFIRLFPILQAIARLPRGMRIVALDGRAASGKTTLAGQLAKITGAGVVHMDDFFLPPELRTEERLAEPGGNVHYERFMEEVLNPLRSAQAFRYRCFDCGSMELGEDREVPEGDLRIVEGAYSCHPLFGEYMGLRVFCDVGQMEQLRRIEQRNGAEMLERFRSSWIPMEEQYFRHFQIRERAGVLA